MKKDGKRVERVNYNLLLFALHCFDAASGGKYIHPVTAQNLVIMVSK